MRDICIYVDESGTFSEYEHTDPYYIVTLVFHDQNQDITHHIKTLDYNLSSFIFPSKAIHTGPIIRREKEYVHIDILERIRVFNLIYYFARRVPFCYKTIIVDKKQLNDPMDLYVMLSKKLSAFLEDNYTRFQSYGRLVIYYDNGQNELTKILLSVFEAKIGNIDYRKAFPSDCKLLQVADLICTLQLLALKRDTKSLSKSELNFFSNSKKLRKSYLTLLYDKAFPANL